MNKLLWLLFGALSVVLGRSGSTAAEPHTPDEVYRAAHLEHWRSEKVLGRATAIAAIIAAVAACYGLYQAVDAANQARRQADAAQQQVRVMADQEKRQLRAYVVPVAFSVPANYAENQRPSVRITFENIGQTPAYDVIWSFTLAPFAYPQSGPVAGGPADCGEGPDQQWSHKSFIGKGLAIDKDGVAVLSQLNIQAIKAWRQALYFAGRICYRDTFGAQHWTEFCEVWVGEGSELGSGVGCSFGNDADREPP
jgi:hypothetical protein